MEILADREDINEILRCMVRIRKLKLLIEELPKDFIADWRKRLKIKERRRKIEFEIIQVRGLLKDKMCVSNINRDNTLRNLEVSRYRY